MKDLIAQKIINKMCSDILTNKEMIKGIFINILPLIALFSHNS
jgi:hypothetical protein